MRTSILVLISSCSLAFSFAGEPTPLIQDAFPQANPHGQPDGWSISHPNHLEQNDSAAEWISREQNGKTATVYRMTKRKGSVGVDFGSKRIQVPEGTASLRIRVRMRGAGVEPGEENWHAPGVGCTYFFPDGTARPGDMSTWIRLPAGDSDWKEYTTTVPVRDGALEAGIAFVSQGWTGLVEVVWIEVAAVPALP